LKGNTRDNAETNAVVANEPHGWPSRANFTLPNPLPGMMAE